MTTIGRNALAALAIAAAAGIGAGAPASAEPAVAYDVSNCRVPWTEAGPLDMMVAEEPIIAKMAGLRGAATVHLELDDNGNVTAATIVTSSGLRSLDAAALAASNGVKFSPETLDCHPIAGNYDYTVTFGD